MTPVNESEGVDHVPGPAEPRFFHEPLASPLPPEPVDRELDEPPIVLDYSDTYVDGKEPFDFLTVSKELESRFMKRHRRVTLKQKIKKRSVSPPLPIERHVKVDSCNRAFGLGSRKTAQARVWITPGQGFCTINGQRHSEYFDNYTHRVQYLMPFEATNTQLQFDVASIISGGGKSGQF